MFEACSLQILQEKKKLKKIDFFENVAMTEPIFSPPSTTQFPPPPLRALTRENINLEGPYVPELLY